MMRFLRSQSRLVLGFVLAVIGVGFLFYGNSGNLLTSGAPHNSNDFGQIDGTNLSYNELVGAVRSTRYALIIARRGDQLNQPGSGPQLAEEAWRQLLLLAEADRLHVVITDDQMVDYIKSQELFQKNGVFDPALYQQWLQQMQSLLGARLDTTGPDPLKPTKDIFETIVRNNLRVNAVSQALFSTVHSSAKDISTQYDKVYGPTTVSVISFDPKPFIDAAQVTPGEIEAAYKAQPMNPAFRTKEKRKVEYVLFTLPPDQAKLPAAEKKRAKDALGEKLLELALAFQPEPSATPGATPPPTPDFAAETKKRNLVPVQTEFFTQDTPPANVPPSPSFNRAAFLLTKDETISKVVELDNGVALLHLVEIQPSELLPLDKVKGDIIQHLKQENGIKAAEAAAAKTAKDLQAAVAKGTDFKTAAAALKLKVEAVPTFVPLNIPQTDMRLQTIAYVATTLDKGKVSDPVPAPDSGSFIVYLDNRTAADPAGLAAFETRYRQSQDGQLRSMVYSDWANWKSRQPGTHRPPDLSQFGGAE